MTANWRISLKIGLLLGACCVAILAQRSAPRTAAPSRTKPATSGLSAFQNAVLQDLERQTKEVKIYNPAYYAGGEPPKHIGVCTDVVLRSYRSAGIDLAKRINADIRQRPARYRLSKRDPGIDHRRCKNRVVYFAKYALSLPVAKKDADWLPGDIVFWDTAQNGNIDHVGVVSNHKSAEGTPSFVHHWPQRPVEAAENIYRFRIVRHFRWKPSNLKP